MLFAGLIGVGIAGKAPASVALGPPASPSAPPLPSTGSPAPSPSGTPRGAPPPFRPQPTELDMAPILTSEPGQVMIAARRHPETMFIHGNVFVPRVTWVYVSLQDRAGRVAGWASVSVPGGAAAPAADGATLRFDVELAISQDRQDGSLWIQVIAYNAAGEAIASSRLEAPAED